jgi:hypothetical protein
MASVSIPCDWMSRFPTSESRHTISYRFFPVPVDHDVTRGLIRKLCWNPSGGRSGSSTRPAAGSKNRSTADRLAQNDHRRRSTFNRTPRSGTAPRTMDQLPQFFGLTIRGNRFCTSKDGAARQKLHNETNAEETKSENQKNYKLVGEIKFEGKEWREESRLQK